MFLLLLEAIICLLIGYSTWWYLIRRPKNFPPGPWGLPLIGYVPFMTMNPGKKFMKLEKKYGPIISFEYGPRHAVMINDFNVMKKAFQDDLYTGKVEGTGETFLQGGDSFAMQDGLKWHEGRRFALLTLRDFGMGKSNMEDKMLDELTYFIKAIKEHKGKPFDLDELFGTSSGNVNTLMLFNMRYDYDNEFKKNMHKLMTQVFTKSILLFLFVPMFPWLVKYGLHKYIPGYSLQKKCTEIQEEFIKEIIESHKKNYYPGKKDDYIDAMLTERFEREKRNDHPEFFDDRTLMTDIRMLSLAANETTSVTMNWMFIYIMAHPDVQKKMQAEIDSVIGRNRQPTTADKTNMPYVEAFIIECFRRADMFTFIDSKRVKEDTTLEGYSIPKDTLVYGNIYRNHHDETLWPDPETFRPERFLDENGKVIRKNTDHLLIFSLGKRNCIGEGLARMNIFLYLTAILQNFTLVPPENEHVTMEAVGSFGFLPKPYKVRAIPRDE